MVQEAEGTVDTIVLVARSSKPCLIESMHQRFQNHEVQPCFTRFPSLRKTSKSYPDLDASRRRHALYTIKEQPTEQTPDVYILQHPTTEKSSIVPAPRISLIGEKNTTESRRKPICDVHKHPRASVGAKASPISQHPIVKTSIDARCTDLLSYHEHDLKDLRNTYNGPGQRSMFSVEDNAKYVTSNEVTHTSLSSTAGGLHPHFPAEELSLSSTSANVIEELLAQLHTLLTTYHEFRLNSSIDAQEADDECKQSPMSSPEKVSTIPSRRMKALISCSRRKHHKLRAEEKSRQAGRPEDLVNDKNKVLVLKSSGIFSTEQQTPLNEIHL